MFGLTAYEWAGLVYSEVHEVLVRVFVLADFWSSSSERIYQGGVGFFAEFGQIKSFAKVAFAFFDEQVGGVRVGLEVLVGQVLAHDKGDGGLVDYVGAGVDGKVHFSFGIGGA
jgi:hypothetical protein